MTEYSISPRVMSSLGDRIITILEKMAFFIADEALPGEKMECADDIARAIVSFKGPVRGKIQLCASMNVCSALAANILGLMENETVTHDRAADAFMEVVNVLAGNILPELWGGTEIINITTPVFFPMTRTEWREIEQSPWCVRLNSVDGPILLFLDLGNGAEKEASL